MSPFDFEKTDGEADINIKWATRKHCEGGSFDESGGVLAHAYYPEEGEVPFEGMETGKKDLYAVAVHEFGHALGIAHKSDKRSLMYSVYGYTDKLHEIDARAVQAIYGIRQRSDQPQPGGGSRIPNLYKEFSIDAITMTKAGKVFVLKGDWYWLLNDEADGIEKGYPRLIAKDWPGLPGNPNAALTFNNGKMYFFKGEKIGATRTCNSIPATPE